MRDSARVLADIAYINNYGVVAPSHFTTNGDAEVLRRNIEAEDLPAFDTWLSQIKEKK